MSEFFYDKTDIYYKTHGICVICGKPMTHQPEHWSLEHFIPRAIYKWVPNPILTKKIESFANLFIVHPRCNFIKDSALPTTHSIYTMHASLSVMREVDRIYSEVKPFINQYKALKQEVWKNQHKKCFFCQKKLSFSQAILRRKHDNEPRSRQNAMCLCTRCSRDLGTPKQLIKEVIVIKKSQS